MRSTLAMPLNFGLRALPRGVPQPFYMDVSFTNIATEHRPLPPQTLRSLPGATSNSEIGPKGLAVSQQTMVPRGLEPRSLRLLAVRSNQLSYETLGMSVTSGCSKAEDSALGVP